MLYRTVRVIVVFLLALQVGVGFPMVAGAGETYTLTPLPQRTQQTDNPGVTLSLSVSGAMIGLIYTFTWFVRDPTGDNRSATDSTTTPVTQSSFILSLNYPANFGGGAHIRYVGTYAVSVSQTTPSIVPNVAQGQFEAGLTDSLTYERTSTVSIKASGYQGNDDVTVDIRLAGVPAQDYPKIVKADSSGNLFDSWPTVPSTPTGNHSIILTGLNTPPKNPPDTQTLIIYPTNVTITQITMPVSALTRTETAEFIFSAKYPLTGSSVQTGSAAMWVEEPDQTSHPEVANWDSARELFVGMYRIPLSGQSGIWAAKIDVGNFDDGFGNRGPLTSLAKQFTVAPATLFISVNTSNETRTVGDVILVSATITSPDGSSFYNGNVSAQFSLEGRLIGSPIPLSYDTSQSRWVGSHAVRENDQSGAWLVQVSASDSYGNSGQGSKSILVNVPPQQSPITSWWFLSLISALTAAIVGLFLFKKKRVLRHELKVDLQAVGREAERVKNQEFFRSVQRQLGRMRDESKEKTDG